MLIINIFHLVLRFVFVRQFRPAIYMARAEEAGTPVTVGTRSGIAGSLFSYDEREAIHPPTPLMIISKIISTGQGRSDSGALCRNC